MGDRLRRHPAASFGVIFLALTAVGEAAVWWATSLAPAPGAQQGQVIDDAIAVLAYFVTPVFVAMSLLLIFSLTVWRVGPEDTRDSELQVRSHRRLSVGWLVTTLALSILAIVYPGVTGIEELLSTANHTPNTLVVQVTAQQWEWTFAYPQYHVAYSDSLVLPVNRPVEFVLKSKDVIHSFWIPSMRIKEAVIPGETRTLFLTPDRLTSTTTDPMARVQCAQVCGIGHAQMFATVRVERPASFTAWARKQATVMPPMG